MFTNNHIAHSLQAYYQNKFQSKRSCKIRNLENMTTGWESEIYTFTLEHGQASTRVREDLVLRLYTGMGAGDKSEHEYHALNKLHKVGYTVPKVYLWEREGSPFGKPFIIIEKIAGQAMWSKLDSSDELEKAALVERFCELFARLHHLDWRLFVDEAEFTRFQGSYVFIDEWLGIAQYYLEQFPGSGFPPAVGWLAERRERFACRRPSPVHNDFHPGNVLLRDGISPVVIDWTGFGVSDARFDLAWTLVLVDSYMGSTGRDTILRLYENYWGEKIVELDCFIVFACLRRLFDITTSLLHGPERLGMRPEAATAMKRDIRPTARVYQLLMERTGLRIKEVDELLSSPE